MECPICFDVVQEDTTTPCCSGPIHRACLHECLNRYHTCPLCRERYHIVEVPIEQVIDRTTKIGLFLTVFMGAGIASTFIQILLCNRED